MNNPASAEELEHIEKPETVKEPELTEEPKPDEVSALAEETKPDTDTEIDKEPEEEPEPEPKDILVVMFVNDNHLSNVKTLQSIFLQQKENVYLLVCNDSTSNFQAERLLYNFLANKPDNIQQIYMVENPCPKGDVTSLRERISFVQTDYVLILHSGEYLANPNTLEQCVNAFIQHIDCQALVFSADRKNAEMKKTEAILKAPQTQTINAHQMRDCMLFYRYDVLAEALQKKTLGASSVCSHVLPHLQQVETEDFVICRFSNASIENTPCTIPQTLGNQRMLKLAQKLAQNTLNEGERSQGEPSFTKPVIPSKPSKKQLFTTWLTRHACRKNILLYGVLALLLIICATMFLSATSDISQALGITLSIVAFIAVLWCGVLVAINLHHKKDQKG